MGTSCQLAAVFVSQGINRWFGTGRVSGGRMVLHKRVTLDTSKVEVMILYMVNDISLVSVIYFSVFL
jgi:hypothetical protein